MSGVNHSIDASSSRGERPISASLSVRAVWGILWGAEPTGSKISTESVLYNKNWWRGLDSNQRRRSQRIYSQPKRIHIRRHAVRNVLFFLKFPHSISTSGT